MTLVSYSTIAFRGTKRLKEGHVIGVTYK
eukprot:SAG11_NODE_15974_length_560_cov_18.770065_2_plen_28_part_01